MRYAQGAWFSPLPQLPIFTSAHPHVTTTPSLPPYSSPLKSSTIFQVSYLDEKNTLPSSCTSPHTLGGSASASQTLSAARSSGRDIGIRALEQIGIVTSPSGPWPHCSWGTCTSLVLALTAGQGEICASPVGEELCHL